MRNKHSQNIFKLIKNCSCGKNKLSYDPSSIIQILKWRSNEYTWKYSWSYFNRLVTLIFLCIVQIHISPTKKEQTFFSKCLDHYCTLISWFKKCFQCLLWAKHCSKCLGYSHGQNGKIHTSMDLMLQQG